MAEESIAWQLEDVAAALSVDEALRMTRPSRSAALRPFEIEYMYGNTGDKAWGELAPWAPLPPETKFIRIGGAGDAD